jgi:hypothetical protein
VFKITTSGQESVISFMGNGLGSDPYSSLVNLGGTLYGTAKSGGQFKGGSVFKVTP